MIEKIATKCQVCGEPMTIGFDTDAAEVIDRERYLKFATCDPCMVNLRRFPRERVPAQLNGSPAPEQAKLPYKDD